MKKKIIIAIVIVAAILAGLAGVKALQIGKLIGGAKTYTVPPETVSSAMVQVMVAPLAARGVKLGILMGSAYLFTQEIVATGAIVPRFQQAVVECERTVNLESGPGHASRCAYTPFAQEFMRQRATMRDQKVPGDESRRVLDDLIMGRLRMASKADSPFFSLCVVWDIPDDTPVPEPLALSSNEAHA